MEISCIHNFVATKAAYNYVQKHTARIVHQSGTIVYPHFYTGNRERDPERNPSARSAEFSFSSAYRIGGRAASAAPDATPSALGQ